MALNSPWPNKPQLLVRNPESQWAPKLCHFDLLQHREINPLPSYRNKESLGTFAWRKMSDFWAKLKICVFQVEAQGGCLKWAGIGSSLSIWWSLLGTTALSSNLSGHLSDPRHPHCHPRPSFFPWPSWWTDHASSSTQLLPFKIL